MIPLIFRPFGTRLRSMKTRRTKDSRLDPTQTKPEGRLSSPAQSIEIPAAKPEPSTETQENFPQGFRVALTADGDVDLDRMNPKSIEKLRIAVNSPAVQKNILKFPAAETEKREPVFPEFIVGKMYDAISMLEVAVSTRLFKIDVGVAERVLPFNEKEKALLVPATATVIDKYSGDWLRTHKDEAVLITMLVLTISAKIVQLRVQLSLLEEQKQARVPASPPPQAPAPSTTEESANGAAA